MLKFTFYNQTFSGHKQQKERLTFLTTCNASGTHKLRPVMIGKAQKPRCFINLTSQSLPVRYFGQKSAWMTGVEFENWFKKEFVPEVKTFLRCVQFNQSGQIY